MNMISLLNTRFLNSEDAEFGANRMIKQIRNKKIVIDISPSSYERYNGELEEKDYISYCNFLQSSNGRNLLKNL